MAVELSSEIVLARDQTLIALRGLAERHPQEVMAAGRTLFGCASRALAKHEAKHRTDADARRAAVALALDVALGRSDMPPHPRRDTVDFLAYPQVADEYGRLKDDIKLFQSVAAELPELVQLDPDDAYVRARGLHGVRCAATHPNPSELPQGSSDPAYYEANARRELGLGERPEMIGFFLGQEVARIADEPPRRLRSNEDWWVVLVATLLAEDPVTPAATLGVMAGLREGEWEAGSGGPLFNHREGIRLYAGADPESADPRDVERNERLWALATRAVSLLIDWESRAVSARRTGASAGAQGHVASKEDRMQPDAESPEAEALSRVLATIESIPNVDFAVPLPVRQKRAGEIRDRLHADHAQINALLARYVPDARLPSPCGTCRAPEALRNPIENLLACYDQCEACREEARRAVVMVSRGLNGNSPEPFLPPEVHAARINAATAGLNARTSREDAQRTKRPTFRVTYADGVTKIRLAPPPGSGSESDQHAPASGTDVPAHQPSATAAPGADADPGRRSGADKDHPADQEPGEFILVGDGWRIQFRGEEVFVKDHVGFGYLRDLIQAQGRRVGVSELEAARRPRPGAHDGPTPLDHSELEELQSDTSHQEVLDDEGREQLREKLRDLGHEIEDARKRGDVDGQERLELERSQILEHVKVATDLRGRSRSFPTGATKSRKAVGQAITRAIAHVKGVHPVLHAHLDEHVKDPTGQSPGYLPPSPVAWRLV